MENKIEGYALMNQEISTPAIISSEKIAELITLLDNLKSKVDVDAGSVAEVECIVQKIIDLTLEAGNAYSIPVIKVLRELSKKYTALLPFLMRTHREAKQDQSDSKAFTKYLRFVLLQPMLLQAAETTQNFFISIYFGKIPIITLSEKDIYAKTELKQIDLFLEENMDLLINQNDLFSALLPYALTFSYLNKNCEPDLTPVTNKTFFNYLMESQIISSP